MPDTLLEGRETQNRLASPAPVLTTRAARGPSPAHAGEDALSSGSRPPAASATASSEWRTARKRGRPPLCPLRGRFPPPKLVNRDRAVGPAWSRHGPRSAAAFPAARG